MTSNVYTKNEILQNLASKGFFIDAYTLDTFFNKWRIEAIFEDEQGSEFYDKNALDLILTKLFNAKEEEEEKKQKEAQEQQNQEMYVQNQNTYEMPQQPTIQNTQPIYPQQNTITPATNNLLNDITLSDGTPLINKVQSNDTEELKIDYNILEQEAIKDINPINDAAFNFEEPPKQEKKMGILEGAMQATGQEFEPEQTQAPIQDIQEDNNADFDDMSLLSESYEAQEKFREYVVSELSKKNVEKKKKNNEFKLDISERTLNMIARSMAKKIAKHVNQIFADDLNFSAKIKEIEQKNKKLEQRALELEDQNKKLRLLLTESNKNLNSYKPSIFGLYKKVPPSQ